MPLFVSSSAAPLAAAALPALVSRAPLPEPALQAAAEAFFARGAERSIPAASDCAVWLLQGECALVPAGGPVCWLGTTDATTCVAAALWCPAARLAWMAHADAPLGRATLSALRALVGPGGPMTTPQLFLAGGYCDQPAGEGPRLGLALLQAFHNLGAPIRLALCALGAANTDAAQGGAPRTRCLALRLSGGGGSADGGGGGGDSGSGAAPPTAYPWRFADGARGPALARRFAAQHARRQPSALIDVYDAATARLRLPPFDPSLGGWAAFCAGRMAAMDDGPLLANYSTSPAHESQWFCDDMRAMAAWQLAAQARGAPQRLEAARAARYAWRARGGGGEGGGEWVLEEGEEQEEGGPEAAAQAAAEASDGDEGWVHVGAAAEQQAGDGRRVEPNGTAAAKQPVAASS